MLCIGPPDGDSRVPRHQLPYSLLYPCATVHKHTPARQYYKFSARGDRHHKPLCEPIEKPPFGVVFPRHVGIRYPFKSLPVSLIVSKFVRQRNGNEREQVTRLSSGKQFLFVCLRYRSVPAHYLWVSHSFYFPKLKCVLFKLNYIHFSPVHKLIINLTSSCLTHVMRVCKYILQEVRRIVSQIISCERLKPQNQLINA